MPFYVRLFRQGYGEQLDENQLFSAFLADAVNHLTCNRLLLGPATLYTILGKFEKEGYIREIEVVGRKRTYEITPTGTEAYKNELARLQQCIADALKWESGF